MNKSRLEGNIWKYTILLVTNKRIFAAILGAYYLTIPDVTAWWIGMLLLIGTVAGFIFEIPSGYISDKLGHKEALIVSRVSMVISTACFLFSESIPALIAGGVFLNISNAFASGTGSAFMHETFRGLGREKDYTRVMGKISAIGFGVPIFLTILIPFFVSISYQVPFLVALVFDIAGLLVAFTLVKPPVTPEEVAEIGVTNFKQVMQESWKLSFFRHAIFTGALMGTILAVSVFRAPYQVLLGVPIVWFGVLHGAGRAIATLLQMYSGVIRDWTKSVANLYLLQLVLFLGMLFVLWLSSNLWVAITMLALMNGLQWGMIRVQEGYFFDVIGKSKFKATLLSVVSQVQLGVSGLVALGLGYVIEMTSYQIGFLSAGLGMIAFFVPLYLYIAYNHKRNST
ncbi:MAG: MFS transporter [Candidatus Paceibacterota bacterium]